jgi:plasmid maintenance system antidote protein VapI
VTPQTAWFFSQALDTSPEFWLNLQSLHDLARTQPTSEIQRLRQAG